MNLLPVCMHCLRWELQPGENWRDSMVTYGDFGNHRDLDGFGLEPEETAAERNEKIHKQNVENRKILYSIDELTAEGYIRSAMLKDDE